MDAPWLLRSFNEHQLAKYSWVEGMSRSAKYTQLPVDIAARPTFGTVQKGSSATKATGTPQVQKLVPVQKTLL